MSVQATPSIAFLCVHNAGRSQMAAGWARHVGGESIRVYSGGSEPASDVNPAAVEAMAEVGVDISANVPERWTEQTILESDVIVTMGCGDSCPVLPGRRYVDWDLDDPAGQTLDVVRRIRDEITARVDDLVESLVET